MNIQKLVFFLLVCAALSPWPAFCQEPSFDCDAKARVAGPEALTLLDKVQSRYGDVKTLQAKFYQHSYLAALETSELSSGDVWFQKPGLMKWHYLQPEEQVFIVKDNVVWLYQPIEKQVVINEFRSVLISDLPVAFLMGIGNLKRDFTLKGACRNADGIVLDLKSAPKDAEKKDEAKSEELAGFKLLVNPTTNFPLGAQISHVGGNITSIILSEIVFNPAIAESLFSPEFPKGVDINDMRQKP